MEGEHHFPAAMLNTGTCTIERWLCVIPRELKRRADFAQRGSSPHHNEIAVDNQTRAAKHMLYDDAAYTRRARLAL